MMTTMAALLGALPLMLGSGTGVGAAPPARRRDRRRADRQPGADAVHDAGDLSRLRPPGRALSRRRPRAGCRRRRRELTRREPLGALHRPAGRDHAADPRHRAGRHARLLPAAGLAAAAGGLPDHHGHRQPARRQPGDRGHQRRRAAGTPSRPDRRRDRDDLAELGRVRRASSLQFGLDRDIDGAARDVQAAINAARADLPTQPAQQSDLPQGQPGRCADPDPGADLRAR